MTRIGNKARDLLFELFSKKNFFRDKSEKPTRVIMCYDEKRVRAREQVDDKSRLIIGVFGAQREKFIG